MPDRCEQEMCPHWTGDGMFCPCALFDIDPEEAQWEA